MRGGSLVETIAGVALLAFIGAIAVPLVVLLGVLVWKALFEVIGL